MSKSLVSLAVVAALVAVGCDARPQAPEFNETTTTSTTLPGVEIATTTTLTLPPPDIRVMGRVTDVIDGDTIEVDLDGVSVDIRLLGINAPEMDECWGQESKAFLTSLVGNQEVLLVERPDGSDDVDAFGRLLRYVYLDSGPSPTFVNAVVVETGHAVGLQDGSENAATFKAFEARAFQSGYGMWGTFACGDREGTAEDRPVIRVSELQFDPEGPDADALSDEYITIVNEGYDKVSIAGWTLRDESTSNRFTFDAGIVLDVGDAVTVVTGCEGGPTGALHWCSDQAVWSNDGDTAIVMDTLGNAVVWYTYSG
ncbi:MAG: lamin tail domain-containing protein [Acidimicrobiia bacterium]|nr:lamin tail domain-containing protein [Acidimicrobiia bacterium]